MMNVRGDLVEDGEQGIQVHVFMYRPGSGDAYDRVGRASGIKLDPGVSVTANEPGKPAEDHELRYAALELPVEVSWLDGEDLYVRAKRLEHGGDHLPVSARFVRQHNLQWTRRAIHLRPIS